MPGPAGFNPIRDGYSSIITIAAANPITLYEREVKPPMLDGGGPIESTSMRNTTWRTKDPKTLKSIGDITTTVMYDPTVFSTIVSLLNTNTYITVRWPDNTTVQFAGYLDKFDYAGLTEGNLPTASVTFVVTNRNPTTGAEVSPVVTNRV